MPAKKTKAKPKEAPQKNDSNTMAVIAGAVILGLVVIFFVNFYTKQSVEKGQTQLSQSNQLLQNKLSQLENTVSELKDANEAQGERLGKFAEFIYRVDTTEENDARIVRSDLTAGKEEVLVESVLDKAGVTGRYDKLVEHAVFPENGIILFRKVLTGGPGADEKTISLDFWKFDSLDGSITNVAILDQFDAVNRDIYYQNSPGKSHVAFVVADEAQNNEGLSTKLYVYELLTGQVKEVLALKPTRTFNGGGGYPTYEININWTTDNTIVADTFSQNIDDEGAKPKMAAETITL